ncbi:MAG: ATP-binding protein [Balneolales bacterium]
MINRHTILALIEEDSVLRSMDQSVFMANDVILKEGDSNRYLYLLMKGEVELHKEGPDNNKVHIDQLEPGDLVGLVSFVSGRPALTSAIALSEVSLLRINHREFEELVEGTNSLSTLFHQLIVDNLLNRYQNTIGLQMKYENLNRQLHQERDQLRAALNQIEAVQQQLVSQEKMALLGELSAGISHELNNPSAALARSVEHLNESLSQIIVQVKGLTSDQLNQVLNIGRTDKPMGTMDVRKKTVQLEAKYPKLDRTLTRKLARCSEDARSYFMREIPRKLLSEAMEVYEAGQILSIMGESTRRITSLVQSLRSFIRPTTGYETHLDVREGLLSTIQLLHHKLKSHELDLDLQDIPAVAGNPGELNQVWTNILDNACDALINQKGKITIRTCHEKNRVFINIINSGPNIPDEVKKRIFDANYTTKNTNGTFGLGIGLTITKDIISKHRGYIQVLDAEGGGAWFRIILPATREKSEN